MVISLLFIYLPICLNWTAVTRLRPAPSPASDLEPPIRRLREAEEAAYTRPCSIMARSL